MTDSFDPAVYGPAFARAIGDEPTMPLDAGRPDSGARDALDSLAADAAGELTVVDRDAFSCCLAALWLLHGYLDECHTRCQDVPTASGSYWHGVMHRREGDYGNAQYWFRRVGAHPALDDIAAAGGPADPIGFVEDVRRAVRQGSELAEICAAQQRAEWRVMFDWCWRQAFGA